MGNNFIQRWSKIKTESHSKASESTQKTGVVDEISTDSASDEPINNESLPLPSMSDVDALESNSSLAGFLSEGVEKSIKKAAMKKIFLSSDFNVLDGLTDYDQDFSSVGSLPAEVAQNLRKWIKEEEEIEPQLVTEPLMEENDEIGSNNEVSDGEEPLLTTAPEEPLSNDIDTTKKTT
ncbi:DUF3306 domain-containing protein [Aliivibrio kagoshimensis]|uniref:DUF3306 domain-containing protein n=1 Tax=Aliivibrio kagoshimensis TaxID=2910230 RepID=UPI003D143D0A